MSKCKVIAIANQKGGVAKTTTTLNLGANLVRNGKKVLMIDLDPQGSLTTLLGYRNPDGIETTIKNLLEKTIRDVPFEKNEGILENAEGLKVVPANIDLASLEINLVAVFNKEKVLSNYINKIKEDYDYILIDCKPSLELLVINALVCADSVIIPVKAEYLSVNGMTELLKTIGKVKVVLNPRLKVEGILFTIADMQTKLANSTIEKVKKVYGNTFNIYKSIIPKAIKVAESGIVGKSIFEYDKNSKVARAYEEFSKEVLKNSERTRNSRTAKCR